MNGSPGAKKLGFTLDLESDYAGCIDRYGIFRSPGRIQELLEFLDARGIKTTVFAVGSLFKEYPDIIRLFERFQCEFEVHSYSHPVRGGDDEQEIVRAREAYYAYFKRYPRGYRAPRGQISEKAVSVLSQLGFEYDSSIFPSYFPNPGKYLFCKRGIHRHRGSGLLEIPLTSITPMRLTLSVSYMKLLGFGFYRAMFAAFPLPDFICFDSHLHDFIVDPDSYGRLSPAWKFVYGRNKHKGLEFCAKFLDYASGAGYSPCFLSEISGKAGRA